MTITFTSLAMDANTKMEMWLEISSDPSALEDRGKTREEALMLANFFEGKFDAFYEARRLTSEKT